MLKNAVLRVLRTNKVIKFFSSLIKNLTDHMDRIWENKIHKGFPKKCEQIWKTASQHPIRSQYPDSGIFCDWSNLDT